MKEFEVNDRVIYTCVEAYICGAKGPYTIRYLAKILRINKKTIRIEIVNCHPHRSPRPQGCAPNGPPCLSVKPSTLEHRGFWL